jgi:hypothetical protein
LLDRQFGFFNLCPLCIKTLEKHKTGLTDSLKEKMAESKNDDL